MKPDMNHILAERTDARLSRLIKSIPEDGIPKGMNMLIMEQIKELEGQKAKLSRKRNKLIYIFAGTAVILILGLILTFTFDTDQLFSKIWESTSAAFKSASHNASATFSSFDTQVPIPVLKFLLPLGIGILCLLIGDLYLRRWYNNKNPDNMIS